MTLDNNITLVVCFGYQKELRSSLFPQLLVSNTYIHLLLEFEFIKYGSLIRHFYTKTLEFEFINYGSLIRHFYTKIIVMKIFIFFLRNGSRISTHKKMYICIWSPWL